ncbi:YALI0A17215p [Yarrowia lipolytica CLIB122]|uniref:YALI0A17215p n=2 Tax=Yarrowia lipolytica TaxID=4952 RepID=Q6CGQ8_YARLI|nr:YALI0A17215p [Yarrowia lipolytica CLIB122]AOW00765.1 hypothetical protein YALI1_A17348g [Yarrowia lipolytica]CAG84086.1 YALI0A17215p [Yarrowia lipolytica CLIB122]|eukprot:XP_500154.1 YALI0A17215p [Yarrowia lipolytica CLIB122]
MDTILMVMWLANFANANPGTPSDPVVLILDNVGFHRRAYRIVKDWPELAHVKFLFLPPNSASFTQPMNLGIIAAMKQSWKKFDKIFHGSISGVDGDNPLVTFLHRLNWLARSWKEIPASAIKKCAMHSPLFFCHAQQNRLLPAYVKRNMEIEALVPYEDRSPRVEGPVIGLNEAGVPTKRAALAQIASIPFEVLFPPGKAVFDAEIETLKGNRVEPERLRNLLSQRQRRERLRERQKTTAELVPHDMQATDEIAVYVDDSPDTPVNDVQVVDQRARRRGDENVGPPIKFVAYEMGGSPRRRCD